MSAEKQREIASKGGQVSRGGRGRLVMPTADPAAAPAAPAKDIATIGDSLVADRAE